MDKGLEHEKKKYKVLDLFCGCGGISEGFSLAGFEIAGGIDFNEYATVTFKHNFAKAIVHNIDISIFPDDQIDKEYGNVDVIVGGPPCQGFSSANRWQKKRKIQGTNYSLNIFVLCSGFILKSL